MRPRRASSGFTLVELLVVIAIIGILAAFVAVGLPKAREMAKMSAMKSNMNQIRTIVTTYYTEHDTYPPAYGYVSPNMAKLYPNPQTRATDIAGSGLSEKVVFFLQPWMSFVREHGNQKLYDTWSRGNGYDTDNDGILSTLEFSMQGRFNPTSQVYSFQDYFELYRGDNGTGLSDTFTIDDANAQLSEQDPRPFIYIAVNERQARIFRKIIYDFADTPAGGSNQSNPRPFNLDPPTINAIQTQLSFPPPSYDAYVLISVGPVTLTGTAGLIVEADAMGLGNFDPAYAIVNRYHLLALATYFLATRDAENNGEGDKELDFEYTARKSRGQGTSANNDLPGRYPKGAGPVIYVGGA